MILCFWKLQTAIWRSLSTSHWWNYCCC